MKTSVSKIIAFSLAITLTLTSVLVNMVHADDTTTTGADWSNFFNSDGTMRSDVTDSGIVETTSDWSTDSGGDGTETEEAEYHVYVAANGDTIVAPSATTLIGMIASADDSGLNSANSTYQTGVGTLASYLDIYSHISSELSATTDLYIAGENSSIDDSSSNSSVQDSIALLLKNLQSANLGNYSEGSTGYVNNLLFTYNYLKKLIGTGITEGMLTDTYLYYSAGNCKNSPVGCEQVCKLVPSACGSSDDSTSATAPTSYAGCPASTIVPGTPSYSIYKVAPNNPLVVGQDPNKRGADVGYSVTIPPTVYTYYIAKPVYKTIQTCTVEGGCGTSAASKKLGGKVVNATVLDHVDCEKHVEVYQESITGLGATASLSQESINWINNKLSAYYYGAHTLQTNFNLIPGLASASTYCSNKVCYAGGSVTRIQFRDPGTYGLSLVVRTSGTPVTTGRTFNTNESLTVSFIAVRLIENGSY
jgi:hypothetical protein